MTPQAPAKMRDSGIKWLGRVPAHWSVVQSRRLFSERNESARQSDEQLTVSQKHGVISQAAFMELEGRRIVQVLKGQDILKHVEAGDFVMSMRSFQGGLEYSSRTGSVSSAYVPLKPLKWVHPRYFRHLFKSSTYIQELQSTSDLVRDGQALRFENFSKVALPVVPIAEQVAIAEYLDRATSRIDTLIAKKVRFIQLLREKRQALITRAVTKGLDAAAQMKDSGVEWLGPAPSKWRVLPLKRDVAFITSGSRGWAEYYSERGALFLRIGNLRRGDFRLDLSEVQRVVPPEGSEGVRTKVRPGDLLFSITAYLGSVSVVPDDLGDAYVSQHVALVRLAGRLLTPTWAAYVALSWVGSTYLLSQGYGGTKVQLALEDVLGMPVTVPPLDEQIATVARLERATFRIDTLIARTERSIELLREHRTALITAAVTGKLDVLGAALTTT